MNIIEGQLLGPTPEHASDIVTAKRSLEKLARYDIETVICYHGGVYRDNIKQRLLELAKE